MSRYADMRLATSAPEIVPDTDFKGIYKGNLAVKNYRESAVEGLKLYFPELSITEIKYGVDRAIAENIKYHPAQIDNSYKKMTVQTTLPELAHYILSKKPIMTTYGCLFTQHAEMPHPFYFMVDNFINQRDVVKKEMFKHPKGSFDFQKYSLLQLLYKLDANAFYGAIGMPSCFYYNFYTAASVTAQGRSLNSAMALFFEMFLDNNVPFGSLNEVVAFIEHTIHDPYTIDDHMVLNHIPGVQETFYKIIISCGFGFVPDDDDMMIIWKMLNQLDQPELTRLYYRNNLYEFCDNKYVSDLIVRILVKLEGEWGDSNKVPDEVKPEVSELLSLLREYVFYNHQIIDRLDKMEKLIRSVSIIQDTDSAIVSYDAFYRFVLPKTRGIDMKIKRTEYNYITDEQQPYTYDVTDYDFENDEIIEGQRLRNPFVIIPQDQLRHSILSILAHCISKLLNEYMYEYTKNSQANLPANENYPIPKNMQCLIFAKTEFLMKRVLLTDAKKHYGSNIELQEGNYIPKSEALDTKGMDAFNKSTSNDAIKERLKKVLFNEILDTPAIEQVKVIKALAIIEKEIFDSISSGKKEFYKPAKVKSKSAYADPMRIQGIKASIAYNALHQDGTESIDLDQRNSIDIAKCDINLKNIHKIQETFPDVYEKAVAFLTDNSYFPTGIESIAIPINEPVPEWLLPFIAYETIISDNVGNFPLESIGIIRGNPNNNKSNIVRF